MYGGYGAYGGYGGYGGAMNSEMRSDMWIQQHVPGGLNSECIIIENIRDFFVFI
jgi:hypothetical protein